MSIFINNQTSIRYILHCVVSDENPLAFPPCHTLKPTNQRQN